MRWPLLLIPGKDYYLVGFIHSICPSRYFLSSFSKVENGEKARILLIEKLRAAVASSEEEPMVSGDNRFLLQLLFNVVEFCFF